jgi:hypothetical protein
MKKIGLLSLALVLALGTLGIGYATWSDNVTIEQTVRTGSFEVGVANMGTNDMYGWNDPGYDKHVATCTSQNVSETYLFTGLDGTEYFEEVTEIIENAYPCYSCNITFKFASGGSVPAHFKSWDTEIVENPDGLCECIELAGWWLTDQYGNQSSGVGMCGLEPALQALQLHESDNITLVIEKHLMQDCWSQARGEYEAPQGSNCTMVHRAKWVQFNKVDED